MHINEEQRHHGHRHGILLSVFGRDDYIFVPFVTSSVSLIFWFHLRRLIVQRQCYTKNRKDRAKNGDDSWLNLKNRINITPLTFSCTVLSNPIIIDHIWRSQRFTTDQFNGMMAQSLQKKKFDDIWYTLSWQNTQIINKKSHGWNVLAARH